MDAIAELAHEKLPPPISPNCTSAVTDTYRPRTALGEKLLALRRAYIESGGALLDEDGLAAELRNRRGGIDG